jgi:hypothetical protein
VLQDSYVLEPAVRAVTTELAPAALRDPAREDPLLRCRQAMESRHQLGVATGLTAALTHRSPDEAWALLVSLSRNANVKVRDVGRVVVRAYGGRLDAEDQVLADRLRPHLPRGCPLLRQGTRGSAP